MADVLNHQIFHNPAAFHASHRAVSVSVSAPQGRQAKERESYLNHRSSSVYSWFVDRPVCQSIIYKHSRISSRDWRE